MGSKCIACQTWVPLCQRGEVENVDHCFLMCAFYRHKQAELIRIISQFCRVTIDCLLRGNNDLPYQTNVHLFEVVQAYIKNSKRF